MASALIAQSVLARAPGYGVARMGVRRPVAVCGSRVQAFRGTRLMGESVWRDASGGARTRCAVYAYNGVTPETVRWGVAAACAVLLLKRDAGARKQFWAGVLALEAPRDWVTWAQSEYGLWVAALGLALKLFYTIPPELDYPLAVYLFLVTAPAQALAQRGTVGAAVLSAALALFVAFQYFSNTVRLSDAFQSEHLLNTLLISFVALATLGFLGLTVF